EIGDGGIVEPLRRDERASREREIGSPVPGDGGRFECGGLAIQLGREDRGSAVAGQLDGALDAQRVRADERALRSCGPRGGGEAEGEQETPDLVPPVKATENGDPTSPERGWTRSAVPCRRCARGDRSRGSGPRPCPGIGRRRSPPRGPGARRDCRRPLRASG